MAASLKRFLFSASGAAQFEFQKLYDRLDIKLSEVGESFYNPRLEPMVKELVDLA